MLETNLESKAHHRGEKRSTALNLLVFELAVYGHHSTYIRYLTRDWLQRRSGQLSIVVSPQFLKEHADLVHSTLKATDRINFIAISADEESQLVQPTSFKTRTQRAFQQWDLICQYARSLKVDHCLILSLDFYQIPIALGQKAPCLISGIYFKPTLHYRNFAHYQPSWKERLQQWRESWTSTKMLRNPKLHKVFCLDPFAIETLNQLHPVPKALHLPDPVELGQPDLAHTEALKQSLQIQPDRKIFLLFGEMTHRKGIYQVLEALTFLPPHLCEKLCVLIVGRANAEDLMQIQMQVKVVCHTKPVQICEQYAFVPAQDVQSYFQMADVVLAPYQKHVGMSGILLQAATAQKPVLSSNYGLMGEMVHRYGLGLAIDSTQSIEIARGMSQMLMEPAESLCDLEQMRQFAEQNSADRFAETIFQSLL